MKKPLRIIILALVLLVFLAGCRAETQNRWRRNMLDYANRNMYITIYALDGSVIYSGVVDGKVTRADGNGTDSSGGSYVYWYDDKNVYHQSNLGYLVTGRPLEEITNDQ